MFNLQLLRHIELGSAVPTAMREPNVPPAFLYEQPSHVLPFETDMFADFSFFTRSTNWVLLDSFHFRIVSLVIICLLWWKNAFWVLSTSSFFTPMHWNLLLFSSLNGFFQFTRCPLFAVLVAHHAEFKVDSSFFLPCYFQVSFSIGELSFFYFCLPSTGFSTSKCSEQNFSHFLRYTHLSLLIKLFSTMPISFSIWGYQLRAKPFIFANICFYIRHTAEKCITHT